MLKQQLCGLLLAWGAGLAAAAPPVDKRIAITIDDVPHASATAITAAEVAQLNAQLLASLRAFDARAVGFVNEDKLDGDGAALLGRWLDAGMELGNHNWGHVGLWKHSLADNEAAVLKGETLLRPLTSARGAPLRYYRHPFTQTGRDEAEKQAFERFLGEHGYQVAPFTIEHDDYLFACAFDRMASGTERERLTGEYLDHLRRAVGTYESMSQQLFGRQIAQVLLIHANRLNAASLGRTLGALREMGYRFIPLDEALADEAYRSPELASKRFGPSWLTRWARQRGAKLSVYGHADPSGWAAERAQALCGG